MYQGQTQYETRELIEKIGKRLNGKRNGKGGFDLCDCPAHGGHKCLSVDLGASGDILIRCHANCTFEAITDALRGMGFWPERGQGGKTTAEEAAERIRKRRAEEESRKREEREKHVKAAYAAKALYDKAPSDLNPDEHPYNIERGGRWTGGDAKRGPWPYHGKDNDALLLPMKDIKGGFWSLQAIGSKTFTHGGRKDYYLDGLKRGNFYTFTPIAGHIKTFYIDEGFFTVQAAEEAFFADREPPTSDDPHGWIVAFDSGNLEPVARAIRAEYPQSEIIILADEGEAGIRAANRAAAASGGKVARPSAASLPGECDRKGYDFDDLLKNWGAEAVRARLSEARKPEPEYLADAAKAADREQTNEEARRQRAEDLANAILNGMQAATDRTEEPPPIKYIIRPQLTDDTGVAFLIGPGGNGKSFQALIRCIAIASGRPIGKAHLTEVTAPAMFFSLEDPPNVLRRRYFHTIAAIEETYGAFTPDQLAALDANLYRLPVRGQMGALMELDGKGNPRPTDNYRALAHLIGRIRPAYVVLDTMSRALGVDENSNTHAAQWINALEEILFDYPGTIFQVVGHTGKGNQDGKDEDPASIRGASAFAWNSRAVEIYTKAGDKDRKALGIEPGAEVFKLYLGKHNYSGGLDAIFFTRNDHGVPIEIDTEALKTAKDRQAYENAIRAVPAIAKAWEAKDGPLNKVKWERNLGQDLTDPAKPKPGREQLAHAALIKYGITFDQVATAIAEAIRRGYVRAEPGERTAKTGPAPTVIVFDHFPPEEVETL